MGEVLHKEKLAGVHPTLVVLVKAIERRLMGTFSIRWGLRTDEQQAKLYAKGRTVEGHVVTNAPTAKTTAHGRGCALDIVPMDGAKLCWDGGDVRYQLIGTIAEALGLEWGGRWKQPHDPAHSQVKGWKSLPWPPQF